MIIIFHKSFDKHFKKLKAKEKEKTKLLLALFLKNPFHPSLDNHSLKGSFLGYRSIDITGDLRAIFKQQQDRAIFVAIGSHSELYS